MSYVYILHSKKDGKLYTGCTSSLKRRIYEHNKGEVFSTKGRGPFTLVYYEVFTSKSDAFTREQWLKTGWGRKHMQKLLANTLKSLGGI